MYSQNAQNSVHMALRLMFHLLTDSLVTVTLQICIRRLFFSNAESESLLP